MADDPRYPYRHHGQAIHGSKLIDYLISEVSLREDHPELFVDEVTSDDTKEPSEVTIRRMRDEWPDRQSEEG